MSIASSNSTLSVVTPPPIILGSGSYTTSAVQVGPTGPASPYSFTTSTGYVGVSGSVSSYGNTISTLYGSTGLVASYGNIPSTLYVGSTGPVLPLMPISANHKAEQQSPSLTFYAVTTSRQKSSTTTPEKQFTVGPTWSVHSFAEEYEIARKPNWDEAGAEPISDNVLNNAETFLSQFPSLPPPAEVSPLSDGALSFVWDLSTGYLFLSIGPGTVLHVFYDVPKLGKWERITSLDNRDVRRRLRSILRALTGVEESSSTTANQMGLTFQDPVPEPCTEQLAA